jgi:hypothetical protein
MSETIGITPKPPETVLPEVPQELWESIRKASADSDSGALERCAADHPREMLCWAALAASQESIISRYAYARVGYHRGLDSLRANGWRGSGYVRSNNASNRPFLSALAQLGHYAGQIGEDDERERCQEFLKQLDPTVNWDDFDYDNPIDFIFAS